MKKNLLTLAMVGMFSFSAVAAIPSGKDVTTNPDNHYLKNSESVDSYALLPPPPEIGSLAF